MHFWIGLSADYSKIDWIWCYVLGWIQIINFSQKKMKDVFSLCVPFYSKKFQLKSLYVYLIYVGRLVPCQSDTQFQVNVKITPACIFMRIVYFKRYVILYEQLNIALVILTLKKILEEQVLLYNIRSNRIFQIILQLCFNFLWNMREIFNFLLLFIAVYPVLVSG